MRAVVLTGESEVRLEEVPDPVPDRHEVLIRVQAAGICGTDLHAPQMAGMFAPGVVLGHEFAGTVVDVGADVRGLTAGQPVVVNPIALACGECQACRSGLGNQCMAALMQISGVARNGGMAELVTVDSRAVHLVPEGLSARDAAWTEPLAVAVRAVWHGQVAPGTSVAVLGAGAIGQLVLQVALNAGAGNALVVEPSLFRREVAAACGASEVVEPAGISAVDRLFDVVFDCTGAPAAFSSALDLVGHGGRVVVLGSYTAPISLEPGAMGRREASIVFSSVYRDSKEFSAALQMLARGIIDIGPLTTEVVPISRHGHAFSSLRDPERAVKIFLDPTAPDGGDTPVAPDTAAQASVRSPGEGAPSRRRVAGRRPRT